MNIKIFILFLVIILILLIFILKFEKKERYLTNEKEKKFNPITYYLSQRKQPNKYNLILGPISLTYHTHPSFPQKIYIFGDRHIKEVRCDFENVGMYPQKNIIGIVEFLAGLSSLKNKDGTDKKIDYFFEFAFNQKFNPKNYKYGGIIQDIYTQFINCIKIQKEDCEYKNIRVHYSDIRFGIADYEIFEELYQKLTDWDSTPKMSLIDEDVKSFWEGLTILFSNPEIILESGKIDKQISDVQLPFQEFITSLRNTLISLFKNLNDKIVIMVNFNREPNLRNKERILEYKKKFSDTMALLMDVYLFARMFRKFQSQKGGFSGIPENIVVYAGDFHTQRYRSWLAYLGFKEVSSTVSNQKGIDFQCLDISSFQQPFFS